MGDILGGKSPMDILGMPAEMMGINPSTIPIVGGLFGDPAMEAHSEQLRNIAAAYQQMRPEVAQAKSQAIQNSLGALAPANNMLAMMYGPQAMMDFQQMGANPVPASMSGIAPQPPKQGGGFGDLVAGAGALIPGIGG